MGELFPGFEVSAADVVVDFGCGPGHACAIAGEVGADVVAVDIDPAVVERVRRMVSQTPARSFQGLVGDAVTQALPDEFATIILAQEVLEHVDDPAAALRELVRIGKRGARYLISVPDPKSECLMRAVAPSWYFEKPGHIRVFQREQLDQLVTESGLAIEKRVSSGFYWSIWWTLRWTTGKHVAPRSLGPRPAVLKHWAATWRCLQTTEKGREAIRALDDAVPKSQVLIARKAA